MYLWKALGWQSTTPDTLWSPTYTTSWDNNYLEAECKDDRPPFSKLVAPHPIPCPHPISPDLFCPTGARPLCWCGIHGAFFARDATPWFIECLKGEMLADLTSYSIEFIMASMYLIEVWGDIEVHDKGARGQFGRIFARVDGVYKADALTLGGTFTFASPHLKEFRGPVWNYWELDPEREQQITAKWEQLLNAWGIVSLEPGEAQELVRIEAEKDDIMLLSPPAQEVQG